MNLENVRLAQLCFDLLLADLDSLNQIKDDSLADEGNLFVVEDHAVLVALVNPFMAGILPHLLEHVD